MPGTRGRGATRAKTRSPTYREVRDVESHSRKRQIEAAVTGWPLVFFIWPVTMPVGPRYGSLCGRQENRDRSKQGRHRMADGGGGGRELATFWWARPSVPVRDLAAAASALTKPGPCRRRGFEIQRSTGSPRACLPPMAQHHCTSTQSHLKLTPFDKTASGQEIRVLRIHQPRLQV